MVVTRAAHQAGGLIERLEEVGARPAALPLIEVAPPADERSLERAASELALFRWLVLTSVNTVEALLPRSGGALPGGLRVAVIGTATAAALASYHREPDLVAHRSRAEGLLEVLTPRLRRGERVLVPQAEDARPALCDGLTAAGVEVVAVTAYAKRLPADAPERARSIFGDGDLGWVTVTSPRIARELAALFGDGWPSRRPSLRAASIGPVTSEALRALGVAPAAEARTPGDAELVSAIRDRIAADESDRPEA